MFSPISTDIPANADPPAIAISFISGTFAPAAMYRACLRTANPLSALVATLIVPDKNGKEAKLNSSFSRYELHRSSGCTSSYSVTLYRTEFLSQVVNLVPIMVGRGNRPPRVFERGARWHTMCWWRGWLMCQGWRRLRKYSAVISAGNVHLSDIQVILGLAS